MIRQELALENYPALHPEYSGPVWTCPACKAQLTSADLHGTASESVLDHADDCADMAKVAAAERERIKAAGGVSACCGAAYHREPGRYGRWECHACGQQCDVIGVIA